MHSRFDGVPSPRTRQTGSEMTLAIPPRDADVTPRRLIMLSVPALLIGVVAALVLWALNTLSEGFSSVLYDMLPDALGVDPAGWWIVLVLTLTGLAVGIVLVVAARPRRARLGDDRARRAAAAAAQPARTRDRDRARARRRGQPRAREPDHRDQRGDRRRRCSRGSCRGCPRSCRCSLAGAATIGALFGTPVAAALLFTGLVAALKRGGVALGPAVPAAGRGGRRGGHDAPAGRAAVRRSTCRHTAGRRRSTC